MRANWKQVATHKLACLDDYERAWESSAVLRSSCIVAKFGPRKEIAVCLLAWEMRMGPLMQQSLCHGGDLSLLLTLNPLFLNLWEETLEIFMCIFEEISSSEHFRVHFRRRQTLLNIFVCTLGGDKRFWTFSCALLEEISSSEHFRLHFWSAHEIRFWTFVCTLDIFLYTLRGNQH